MRKITSAKLSELGIVSDDDFASLPDEKIAEVCGKVSFDVTHFLRRIAVRDRWTQLITSHLFLEHISMEFLDQEFVNKGVVRVDRWGLLQKVELLRALGVLSEEVFLQITKINNLRNRAAHSYQFKISEKEIKELLLVYPSGMFRGTDLAPNFKNALYVTVALFEHERKMSEISALNRRKASANLRIALRPFDKLASVGNASEKSPSN